MDLTLTAHNNSLTVQEKVLDPSAAQNWSEGPKSVGCRWSCVGEGKYTIIKENMRGEYSVIPWDRRFRSELKLFKIKNIASNHTIWNIDCKYLSRTIFDTFDL